VKFKYELNFVGFKKKSRLRLNKVCQQVSPFFKSTNPNSCYIWRNKRFIKIYIQTYIPNGVLQYYFILCNIENAIRSCEYIAFRKNVKVPYLLLLSSLKLLLKNSRSR